MFDESAGPSAAVRLFSSLLPFVVEAVHSGEPFPMVMSMHLSLLARLLLVAPALLSQLMASVAAERATTEADIFSR